jgi:glutamate N-acetyltransferase/amino-acid N-acetyltransferase
VLVNGEPEDVDEARAKDILQESDIGIKVDLGCGSEKATYWTCDLSYVSAIQTAKFDAIILNFL